MRGRPWPTRKPPAVTAMPSPALGRSVLVTGGNRGIGLATARAFAALGDRVAVTHHSTEPPKDLLSVKCDVGDPSSVADAVAACTEQHGPVEVLVVSAGITRDALLVRMDDRDWYAVLDTSLTGAWSAAREIYLVDKPGAPQSQVRIGWVGVARSTPDYFPITVMNTVLGGSFTSRLNMNLREKHGYSYGASSQLDMRLSAGPFSSAAGVQTD